MTDIDWNRAKELLAQALELQGDARQDFLERMASENETVGREVRTLVDAHEDAERAGFLSSLGALAADPLVGAGSELTVAETQAEGPALPEPTIAKSASPETIAFRPGDVRDQTLPAGQVPPSPAEPKTSAASQPQMIANDFEVLEELGVGGMGVVYRALQHSLRRHIALKIIPTRMLRSSEQVARFYLEAEAAGRLDHPGIVPVQSVGEHDGVHYYAMALVEGGSLARYVSKPGASGSERLSPRRAAEIMEQVCRAVQYAHDRAVIHRDIKPANILLDQDGKPRLTDFGLAKVTDDDDGLTVTGQVMGTPSYMAPEQAEGKNLAISNRTDVYSLGATLYALLAGKPPFTAETLFGTLRKVQNDAPAPLGSNAPLDLATICVKCLAKRPEDRYSSAGAVADDLRRYLDGFPISARRLSAPQRAWRWARRNPTLASLIAAVAGALLVGTIVSTLFAFQASREATAKTAALAEAEANAQQLSEAIEETFIFASEDLLADEPGMQAARRRLLEIAQRYYQQLSDSGYGAADKLANAAFMLGRVQASLGHSDDARRSLDRAIALQTKTIDDQPRAGELMVALARTHNAYTKLGKSLWHQGQIDRPTAASRAGLALWLEHAQACTAWREQAAAIDPSNLEWRRLYANALMNLALAQIEQVVADPQAAIDLAAVDVSLEKAQSLRKHLLDQDPQNGLVVRDLAMGEVAIADALDLRANRSQDQAPALWQASLEMIKGAANRLANLPADSRTMETDFNLATCYQRAGRQSYLLGDLPAAIASYHQMLSVTQDLLLKNPRVGRFRIAVAEAQFNLSMLSYASDDLDSGAALLADCQDTLADGVALNPGGESLPLLVQHTLAIAEGLAINDQVPREVQRELLRRANGLIRRAQELLTTIRVGPEQSDLIKQAGQRLEEKSQALAERIKPDRGV